MLVRQDSIKVGMRMLYEHAGLVVEPSAALGVAAVLEEPERFAGRLVTTIVCGSNVGPADFAAVGTGTRRTLAVAGADTKPLGIPGHRWPVAQPEPRYRIERGPAPM